MMFQKRQKAYNLLYNDFVFGKNTFEIDDGDIHLNIIYEEIFFLLFIVTWGNIQFNMYKISRLY